MWDYDCCADTGFQVLKVIYDHLVTPLICKDCERSMAIKNFLLIAMLQVLSALTQRRHKFAGRVYAGAAGNKRNKAASLVEPSDRWGNSRQYVPATR